MMIFQERKKFFEESITLLIAMIIDIVDYRTQVDGSNQVLLKFIKNAYNNNFVEYLDCLFYVYHIIKRNRMKCVLFGKTSNGKSAVLNALLETKLPSNKGRTTSCFIKVTGCDGDEGYFIDKNNKRHSQELLQIMANELSDQNVNKNSMLHLHWPTSKSFLLKYDIEMWESPGMDYTPESDKWIKEYYQDADVFVLVVNGIKTLSETDKSFLKSITRQISQPNIVFVVNKLDLMKKSQKFEEAKNQHVETILEFLTTELKLYSENIMDRIHFISATAGRSDPSFLDFETCLIREMSTNAITTKFEPHLESIRCIALELNDTVQAILSKSRELSPNINELMNKSIKNHVNSHFEKLQIDTAEIIDINIREIKSQIQYMLAQKTNFSSNTIGNLEKKFVEKLVNCFEENMKKLKEQLMEEYKNRCLIDVDLKEMSVYCEGEKSFSLLKEKYAKNLWESILDSFMDTKNLTKDKERSIRIASFALNFSRNISKASANPLWLAIPNGQIIFGFTTALAQLLQLIPDPSTKGIEEYLLSEYTAFYSNVTNFFINECKIEALINIEGSLATFVKHQREISKFFNSFEKFRTNVSYIFHHDDFPK